MFDEEDVREIERMIRRDLREGVNLQDSAEKLRRFLASDMYPALEEAAGRLQEEQSRIGRMRRPRVLRGDQGDQWYTGPSPEDALWWAYRRHLLHVKGLDPDAVDALDRATTRTLSLMSPPGLGRFNTRGLVLGYVQSGKTANYVGLIAKAADAGYRFFIVMTGMVEALRRQTQQRIEDDLIALRDELWVQLTHQEDDFRQRGNVNAFLNEHQGARPIAVVKKNAARLARLIRWIRGARPEILRSLPVLIIDDEADQASINTRDRDERTRINSQILDILDSFPKAAYVGYTATPFANVLIDPSVPEDLYPRDFIVDLPRPDGYFGPERVFGREPLSEEQAEEGVDGFDMIRVVPDDEAEALRTGRQNPEGFAPEVPSSLREAALYFWLATAARRQRAQTDDHSTMLVHTSQLAADHEATRPLLVQLHADILSGLEAGSAGLGAELRELWLRESAAVGPQGDDEIPVTFEQLEGHLAGTVRSTRILCENHRSADRIDYSQPRQVAIVIGGNVLSRGLTLEGLVVSYFARRAGAYDTLLQMGRWFGFRPGYSDLPRIWMTEALQEYFRDLAAVEEELRRDTHRYEYEGLTPMDFAVRIRRHPVLNITSPGKMQDAVVVKRSFEGRRLQTILFRHRDGEWLRDNIEASKDLIGGASAAVRPAAIPYGWLMAGVEHGLILRFLGRYHFHENSRDLNSDLLRGYIDAQVERRGRLQRWNLVVMSRERADRELGAMHLGLPADVPLINRARMRSSPAEGTANIKALMSRPDAVADFPERYGAYDGEGPEELVQWRSRNHPGVGCLLLYPIARNSRPRQTRNGRRQRTGLDAVEHVIGAGLVFPSVPGPEDTPQNYTYVSAPLQPEDYIDDLEDDQ